jgi:hypothetical protein
LKPDVLKRLSEIGQSDSDFTADRSHYRDQEADGQLRAELYGILNIGDSDDDRDYITEEREKRRREAEAELKLKQKHAVKLKRELLHKRKTRAEQ